MKHIVILKKQPFNKILSGQKTIESRWSINKIVPYNKLKENDILFLKETGKDVNVTAQVETVKYYKLNDHLIKDILDSYSKDIGIEDKEKFFLDVKNKKYCTLIWLKNIKRIDPIKVKRSNGSGWLVI